MYDMQGSPKLGRDGLVTDPWGQFGTPRSGLSIQNGTMTIVVTTHGGRAITTNNSLYPNASESEDCIFSGMFQLV